MPSKICKTSKTFKVANITTTTMAVGRANMASSLLFKTFDQVRQTVLDHLHQVAVIVAKAYVDTNSPVKWVKPNQWQRKTAQVSYVLPSPIWARIAKELDIDGCTVHLHSIICQESL